MFRFCSLILIFGVAIVYGKLYKIPEDFKLGVASSAYQIEGGWNDSGKGVSIWDNLTHVHPDYSYHQNGDVACDSYHKWREDVKLLKYLGVTHYRFSIAWTRILPTGFSNEINQDGIQYYNNLIDELIKNDIEPLVTMFHFDLPQSLQDLGGLASLRIAKYFEDYARVLFESFGDRVKNWITFNEPLTYCDYGYIGKLAPVVLSDGIGTYLCGKTLLIAHGRAFRLYEREFREKQKGKIGITINTYWVESESNSKEDKEAQQQALDIMFGWWVHPIFSKEGNYPRTMIDRIGYVSKAQNFSESRLPPFTEEEIKLIRGSFDFLGLNYYTSRMIRASNSKPKNPPSFVKDVGGVIQTIPQAEKTSTSWLQVYPKGIRSLLNYIKEKYNNPPVIVTENGYPDGDGKLCDSKRIDYIQQHLIEIFKAKFDDSCNVFGYTYWGFLDDYEWIDGYTSKFGVVQVDFSSQNKTRTPKASAEFFRVLTKLRVLETDKI